MRTYIQGDSGGICNTLWNDSSVILSKKVHMNMGPILNGYRDMVKRRYGPCIYIYIYTLMILSQQYTLSGMILTSQNPFDYLCCYISLNLSQLIFQYNNIKCISLRIFFLWTELWRVIILYTCKGLFLIFIASKLFLKFIYQTVTFYVV
jgi:hypothetical protein